MKFLVLKYSCLQNPWLGGYRPQIPVLSVLCPQLNLLTPPPKKIPGYATGIKFHCYPLYRRPTGSLSLYQDDGGMENIGTRIHGKWPTWCTILFYVFIFIFNSTCFEHIVFIIRGDKLCQYNLWCLWPCRLHVGSEVHFWPADDTATDTGWQLPEVVLTQFVSPDDQHDVLETCRELKINTWKRTVCHVGIYQESLHDARSTNYKICTRNQTKNFWLYSL